MATLENRISAAITPVQQTAIQAAITAILTNLPFLINLDPGERRTKRKTGTKREGYVVAVYQALLAHPEVVPSSFSMAEWTKDETLNTTLKNDFSLIGALAESIDDTLLQISNERIKQADAGYSFLQAAAQGNAALTNIIESIAQQFLGQGRQGDVPVTSIPAGGSVAINNAVPDTRLSNMGETVLKLTMNNVDTLVRPGDVAMVTVKQITITNQSATTPGSFSVKTK